MKKVILESPYKGNINTLTTKHGIDAAIDLYEIKVMFEQFRQYAHRCVLDCLKRDESPVASHLIFTQMLDDKIPSQRSLGIQAGFAWHKAADYCVVYTDFGISEGMRRGIENAEKAGLNIHYRKLYA